MFFISSSHAPCHEKFIEPSHFLHHIIRRIPHNSWLFLAFKYNSSIKSVIIPIIRKLFYFSLVMPNLKTNSFIFCIIPIVKFIIPTILLGFIIIRSAPPNEHQKSRKDHASLHSPFHNKQIKYNFKGSCHRLYNTFSKYTCQMEVN